MKTIATLAALFVLAVQAIPARAQAAAQQTTTTTTSTTTTTVGGVTAFVAPQTQTQAAVIATNPQPQAALVVTNPQPQAALVVTNPQPTIIVVNSDGSSGAGGAVVRSRLAADVDNSLPTYGALANLLFGGVPPGVQLPTFGGFASAPTFGGFASLPTYSSFRCMPSYGGFARASTFDFGGYNRRGFDGFERRNSFERSSFERGSFERGSFERGSFAGGFDGFNRGGFGGRGSFNVDVAGRRSNIGVSGQGLGDRSTIIARQRSGLLGERSSVVVRNRR